MTSRRIYAFVDRWRFSFIAIAFLIGFWVGFALVARGVL